MRVTFTAVAARAHHAGLYLVGQSGNYSLHAGSAYVAGSNTLAGIIAKLEDYELELARKNANSNSDKLLNGRDFI